MSKVLILGGAGYLGLALGQALLRTGNYAVFATTRDAKKSNKLLENEITPLVGQFRDPGFIKSAIAEHRINVIVDASQGYEDAGFVLQQVLEAAKERRQNLAADGAVGPKLGLVYCSGVWVHGSSGDVRVDDTMVPGTKSAADKPATAVSWRPAHEQAVVAAQDVLDVAVLRPGAIYGRGSWAWSTWWEPLLAATAGTDTAIQVPADKTSRTGVTHVDDVAGGFVAAIGQLGRLGSWPVFDLVGETVEITTVMEESKRVLGAKGEIVYLGTMGNPFLEALALVSNVTSNRARSQLGWTPLRRDFVRNLPQIVLAWKAAREGSE